MLGLVLQTYKKCEKILVAKIGLHVNKMVFFPPDNFGIVRYCALRKLFYIEIVSVLLTSFFKA